MVNREVPTCPICGAAKISKVKSEHKWHCYKCDARFINPIKIDRVVRKIIPKHLPRREGVAA